MPRPSRAQIAQDAASDATAQSNVPLYSSRAAVVAGWITVPPGLSFFRTNGRLAEGDGQGAGYRYSITEPVSSSDAFQVPDGRWFYAADFAASVTSPAIRSMLAKLRDRRDIRDYDGVDLTGNNAATTELQRALDDSAADGEPVFLPSCDLTTDAPLVLGARAVIEGVRVPGVYDAGAASWIKFSHTGKGITGGGVTGSARIARVGFHRNQPAPAPGWAPLDHDFDLYLMGQDVDVSDCMFLNATRALKMVSPGRLNVRNIKGQPFKVGIEIESSYDVSRVVDVHFWPFWTQNEVVRDYTQSNLSVIRSGRNDNPFFCNIFSIWHRYAVEFFRWAGASGRPAGSTSKAKFVNCDFDIGTTAIKVNADASNVTADFSLMSTQGRDIGSGDALVTVEGDYADITINSPRFEQAGGNVARIDGDYSTVTMTAPQVGAFNTSGIGYPALETTGGGSKIVVLGDIRSTSAITVAGNVSIPNTAWSTYTPTVSSLSGTISSASASGYYRQDGKTITVTATITVTSNGSGATGLSFSLPAQAGPRFYVGSGREQAVNGKGVSVTISPSGSAATVVASGDNTYPAADGAVIVASVTYEVA